MANVSAISDRVVIALAVTGTGAADDAAAAAADDDDDDDDEALAVTPANAIAVVEEDCNNFTVVVD